MSNVFKKLQQARVILQEKNLKKSGSNKFAGFNYFELADFLPTLNLIMDEIGLTPVFYIVDSMAFLDIYDNDSDDVSNCIHFSTPIAEAQLKGCTPIQCLGAVNTYCKRYLYLNALEIVENDVLDSQAGSENIISTKEEKTEKKEVKAYICSNCGKEITQAEYGYSQNKFKKPLCRECQKLEK